MYHSLPRAGARSLATIVAVTLLMAVTIFAPSPADAHSGKFNHTSRGLDEICPEGFESDGEPAIELFGTFYIRCMPTGYVPIGSNTALCSEAGGRFIDDGDDICTFDRARDCGNDVVFRFVLTNGQCMRLALVEAEFGAKPIVTVTASPDKLPENQPTTVVITFDNTMHIVPATEVSLSTLSIDGAAVEYVGSTCGGDQFEIVDSSFVTSMRTVPAGESCTFTLQYIFPSAATYVVSVSDAQALIFTGDMVSEAASDSITITPARECDGKKVTIDLNVPGVLGSGTDGPDVIMGTDGPDIIDAGGGDDTVCARGGDDVVIGGEGADKLIGGEGRDIMRGNAGADVLDGGVGNDRLMGGVDEDTLNGGEGDDFLGGFGGGDSINGGAGNDIIFGGFGADIINAGDGDDEVHGLVGDDTINGGPGNDQLDGDTGNDTINGGPGDDTIRGGNANDLLNGNSGSDSVSGGKADDILSGGPDDGDVCIGNDQKAGDAADATCEQIFGVP